MGQVGPKWDKYGTFSYTISDMKKYRFCPIWDQFNPLQAQILNPRETTFDRQEEAAGTSALYVLRTAPVGGLVSLVDLVDVQGVAALAVALSVDPGVVDQLLVVLGGGEIIKG